jgi:hypothetical protein
MFAEEIEAVEARGAVAPGGAAPRALPAPGSVVPRIHSGKRKEHGP